MNIKKLMKTTLLTACCCFLSPVMASTTDGMTPSDETVCDDLTGKAFGICNAYCEAMDCDNPNHRASDKACSKKFDQWVALNGEQEPLPCEDASLSIAKTATSGALSSEGGLLEVVAPAEVNYSILVTNTGSVAIEVDEVNDDILQNLSCIPELPAHLEPAESVECTESANYDSVETHMNTANSSGVTLGGYEVATGQVSLTVDVSEPVSPQCPARAVEACAITETELADALLSSGYLSYKSDCDQAGGTLTTIGTANRLSNNSCTWSLIAICIATDTDFDDFIQLDGENIEPELTAEELEVCQGSL